MTLPILTDSAAAGGGGPIEGRIQGVLDLGVGPLGVQVHRPGEVHQGQMGVAQLVVNLK